MITRLKRCAYAQIVTIVVLVLWAALAASPAAANAKATSLAKDPQSTDQNTVGVGQSVVVAPGDSLWTISARWLGPEATTAQTADGVERIYALNEQQIGSSPDLILAGQRLLLPSEAEPRSPEPGRAAAPTRHAGEPAEPRSPSPAENNGSGTAVGTAHSGVDRRAIKARDEAGSQLTLLPVPARPAPVAAHGSLAASDASPSLAQSLASRAQSAISAIVPAAGEAFPRGSHSGRELLGGALIAMSTVLALILALLVAREVWGPSLARRRARERWVREALQRRHDSCRIFDTRYACAAASAFEGRPPQGSTQKADAASPTERPLLRRLAARLANSAPFSDDPSDDFRKIGRSRRSRVRQTRTLKVKRPPLGHRTDAASGPRLGQARHRSLTPLTSAQRTRALRRKGDGIVGTEPTELDHMQQWKIGEPLKRALEGIPLQPGAPARDALLEVRPLVADALRTVALLEQRRRLTVKEQRQARALQNLSTTIEKEWGNKVK